MRVPWQYQDIRVYGSRIACNMFKNKIWKDIVENNKCGIPIDPENITEIISATLKLLLILN